MKALALLALGFCLTDASALGWSRHETLKNWTCNFLLRETKELTTYNRDFYNCQQGVDSSLKDQMKAYNSSNEAVTRACELVVTYAQAVDELAATRHSDYVFSSAEREAGLQILKAKRLVSESQKEVNDIGFLKRISNSGAIDSCSRAIQQNYNTLTSLEDSINGYALEVLELSK